MDTSLANLGFVADTRLVTKEPGGVGIDLVQMGAVKEKTIMLLTDRQWSLGQIVYAGKSPLVRVTVTDASTPRVFICAAQQTWYRSRTDGSGLAEATPATELHIKDVIILRSFFNPVWKVVSVEWLGHEDHVYTAIIPDFHLFSVEEGLVVGAP